MIFSEMRSEKTGREGCWGGADFSRTESWSLSWRGGERVVIVKVAITGVEGEDVMDTI